VSSRMSGFGVDWKTLEEAFDELLALPDSDRAAMLQRVGAVQPELRAALGSLLRHIDATDPLLDASAIESLTGPDLPPITLAPGVRIGAYRIQDLIGRGGMGEVYRAQRADGQFEQAVAVKLLRVDPGASILRFNAERQILAGLDHPGIARLLDGGVYSDGRPYMVMELVEGETLCQWCEAHRSSLAQRLALFLQVCESVAYAHSHLVVHRDLKSSNILVTPEGRTKLLDFGIAKLLQSDTAGDATRTAHLSPAYAAPEQLTGGLITTATDSYGLGVTLYQLLTAQLPWEVSELPLAAAVRRLLEERLVPASAAVAEKRGVPARELRGDLDAIIAKALRKDPLARYPDARSLADDLARFLRHEPVLARSGARAYVFRSFVRRRWLPICAVMLLLAILTLGIAGTLWQASVARRHAAQAEVEASKATAVKDFLLDIFRQSSLQSPGGAEARKTTAEQLLAIGAQRIRVKLREQPEVRGELLTTLASLYSDLGVNDQAIALAQERVDDLERSANGARSGAMADAQIHLARALIDNGRDADALGHLDAAQAALDSSSESGSLTRASLLLQRARAAYDGSPEARAAGLGDLKQALAIVEKWDPKNPLHGEVLEYFGYYAQLADDYALAETWKRRFLDFELEQGLEGNAFAIGNAYLDLGDVQALAHEYSTSEANLRQAIALLASSAGQDHPVVAAAKSRLAEMYYRSGRMREAEPLLLEALATEQKTAQGLDDSTETVKNLARVEYSRGNVAKAEALLRRNLAQMRDQKDQRLRYAISESELVAPLTAAGKFVEARQLQASSSEELRQSLGENSLGYARSLLRGAALELGEGHLERASALYQQVGQKWAQRKAELSDTYVMVTLGQLRVGLLRGESEAVRRQGLELVRAITASAERQFLPDAEAQAQRLLGESLVQLGRAGEAIAMLRRAVELRENLDDPEGLWLAEARVSLAAALIALGRYAEARELVGLARVAQAHQPALSNLYLQPLHAVAQQLSNRPGPERP
jgi:eukaryotic-like serine/threonine-protein kinase